MSTNQQELAPDGAGVIAGDIQPIYLHLALTDPEVVAAVSEYKNPTQQAEFAVTCVKIGVLSLRAARGVVDGDAIRREGDHLIEQLTERLANHRTMLEQSLGNSLMHYFDPKSGLFSTRVENLVKPDGDLVNLIQGQVSTVQQQLSSTFEKFIGENSVFLSLLTPDESNQMLSAMRQTVEGVLQAEKTAILSQFSLDEPTSALSRLVRELTSTHGNLTDALGTKMEIVVAEFSLDKPDSALSRLVNRVEDAQQKITREFSLDSADSALSRLKSGMEDQIKSLAEAQQSFHTHVVGLLSSMQARKEAESRSTTHGAVFEEAVGERLRAICGPAGDIVEDCGTTTGLIRASKIGDFVVNLSPESAAAGARIVVEAKESGSYTLKSTLDEADEARRNRGAGVSLFVHSSQTAPAGLDSLAKFGNDVVVVWDATDQSSDVILKAGYLTAKAISLRAAQHTKEEAASFQKIDKAIEIIRKQIEGFTEITTSSGTIESASKKIFERTRIMRVELEKQVQTLTEQIANIKEIESGI